MECEENTNRSLYKEAIMGFKRKACVGREEDLEDGEISDDDVVKESTDPS